MIQNYITFKSRPNLINILKEQANYTYRWSANNSCPDKSKAAADEAAFKDLDIIEVEDQAEIIKATAGGFYVNVHYTYTVTVEKNVDDYYTGEDIMNDEGDIEPVFSNTKTETEEHSAEVVLFVNDWLVNWPYKTSLEYIGDSNYFDVLTFVSKYQTAPDIFDTSGEKLAENCEAIERSIPGSGGQPYTGGPARVATFLYNYIFENGIISDSKFDTGCVRQLGIGQLKFAGDAKAITSHSVFRKGSGTPDVDFEDEVTGIGYEFKGPNASIATSGSDLNKSKGAPFILHYTKNDDLVLYKRVNDNYVEVKRVKATIPNLEAADYVGTVASFPQTWEEYWK